MSLILGFDSWDLIHTDAFGSCRLVQRLKLCYHVGIMLMPT